MILSRIDAMITCLICIAENIVCLVTFSEYYPDWTFKYVIYKTKKGEQNEKNPFK